MRERGLGRHAAALMLGVVMVSACSSGHASAPPPSTPATPPRLSGSLTVFAAASLTGAFERGRAALSAADPGLTLTFNFAGSNTLAAQILQGAPADVFASADRANMDKLVAAGLVDPPVNFARNRLEIAVAAGNPKRITGLADLARPGISVVLEAVGVPAGDYARRVLQAQHLIVSPRSLETDVKAALAKVTSGEADATVVYVTDVAAAGGHATGVAIPDADQPSIDYPMAVVKATRHRTAAQAFVDAAVTGQVQDSLESAGFLPPS